MKQAEEYLGIITTIYFTIFLSYVKALSLYLYTVVTEASTSYKSKVRCAIGTKTGAHERMHRTVNFKITLNLMTSVVSCCFNIKIIKEIRRWKFNCTYKPIQNTVTVTLTWPNIGLSNLWYYFKAKCTSFVKMVSKIQFPFWDFLRHLLIWRRKWQIYFCKGFSKVLTYSMSKSPGSLDKISVANSWMVSWGDFPPPPDCLGKVNRIPSNNWKEKVQILSVTTSKFLVFNTKCFNMAHWKG